MDWTDSTAHNQIGLEKEVDNESTAGCCCQGQKPKQQGQLSQLQMSKSAIDGPCSTLARRGR
jgi:hypothetical protein